jgi:hypothetical protein
MLVGFSLNNPPFPNAGANFRLQANDISFYMGVVSHDAKFKLIKRKNQRDDSVQEIAKLNDFLQEGLSLFSIYCEEDPQYS